MNTKSKQEYFFKLLLFVLLIAGIVLRIYAFSVYRPLWRDESNLALNIYFKNYIDLWGVLSHTQSAPPIFMTLCKLINTINPYKPEYFLRLFPLVSGIVSVWIFYLFTKKKLLIPN